MRNICNGDVRLKSVTFNGELQAINEIFVVCRLGILNTDVVQGPELLRRRAASLVERMERLE